MYFRRFFRDSAANVTIILSLSAIPLFLAAGAAMDTMRATDVQTLLQSAADAAAIAGGTKHNSSEEQIDSTVKNYLAQNGALDTLKTISKIEHGKTKEGNFFVRIQGTIDTSFMVLAGIQTMQVGAYSEMHAGGQAAEIALVLDNTGSMQAEGRLETLKKAAHDLIGPLFENKPSDAYVKVGIVPFAQYVNVGTGNKGASWLKFVEQSSSQSYCSYPPDDIAYNCHTVTYPATESYAGGTYQVCDSHTKQPVCSNVDAQHNWYGCVGSRKASNDEIISNATGIKYPAIWDSNCTSPIADLTDNVSVLNSKIDAMQAVGETYIPGGLIWGWNVLDPSEPFTTAKQADDAEGTKVKKYLVLMTDGANTIAPNYNMQYYYPDYGVHYPSTNQSELKATDSRMTSICNNIKAAGITIFTVGLKVEAGKQALLNACASDPTKAFQSDSNEALLAAFADIGSQLQQVALTK